MKSIDLPYRYSFDMLGESALALLDSDAPGGFWTPVTALGDDLISRLVEHAGLTFEVL
jgi:short subunit dehydrogenase-like uncharacterized protein